MKKPIVLSIIMLFLLLTCGSAAPAYAWDSAKCDAPAFDRLTPGVYVNGWPRFTIKYPKDWVEQRPMLGEVFWVKAPGPERFPSPGVFVGAYSLPLDETATKDGPVKVPPEVQAFLDKHHNDVVSHDLTRIVANYSERYLNSGKRKGEKERLFGQLVDSWSSSRGVITDFVTEGNKAYLTGFVITNLGAIPITDSIIKENGEWKFYGNQRDPAP